MISGNAKYIINNKYSQVQDPIQFGTLTRIGTADFYPGTGYGAYGCFQVGYYGVMSSGHIRFDLLKKIGHIQYFLLNKFPP